MTLVSQRGMSSLAMVRMIPAAAHSQMASSRGPPTPPQRTVMQIGV